MAVGEGKEGSDTYTALTLYSFISIYEDVKDYEPKIKVEFHA